MQVQAGLVASNVRRKSSMNLKTNGFLNYTNFEFRGIRGTKKDKKGHINSDDNINAWGEIKK